MKKVKEYFRKKIFDIKFKIKSFKWINAYFSPFRPLKPKFYIGKIKIGTPYFLPRTAIKDPNRKGYKIFKPKKFGFDFVGLGYKTKWTNIDYRLEYSPIWSFVFFKWQIAITFVAPYTDHYWECWLYYYFDTNKKLTKKERIIDCIKNKPCIWVSRDKVLNCDIYTNYYDFILKEKYKPLVN